MTQEEKKAYNEVIDKVAYFIKKHIGLGCMVHPNSSETKESFNIFPELKESEDERIVKELLTFFRESMHGGHTLTNKEYDSWIAWLEKQGEQKVSTVDFKAKDWYVSEVDGKIYNAKFIEKTPTNQARKLEIEKAAMSATGIIEQEEWFIKGAEWSDKNPSYISSEKQGEQKPIDKVKPKFHEGEWITNGNYTWKIVEVKSLDYILQSQDGNIVDDTISHVDEQFHSFTIETIEDVEDGDVLAVEPIEGYSSSFVAIYKKQNEEDFDSYCFVGFDGKFYDGENGHSTEGIHPATKEQRDLLFQKMKEAGYEWDAGKKELKKIKQKNVWSEEDENNILFLTSIIEECFKDKEKITLCGDTACADFTKEEVIDRLKSLRPHNTWKPSDEQMKALNNIIVNGRMFYSRQERELMNLYNDLKKLRGDESKVQRN